MDIKELEFNLLICKMDGYIIGLDRSVEHFESRHSHIYKGTFSEPTRAMCKYGCDEDGGFSIFRNNPGIGICKNCLRNTLKDLNKPLK
jgi:hypothetical protein